MSVQAQTDNTTVPFIRYANPGYVRDDQIILQDGGRATPLLRNTLMAKVAATQKWVPFTNEAATDGSAHPQGVYIGDDIAAADIVAGDVTDVLILTGAAAIDENQLVIENSKTLDTVITVGTTDLRTVRDHLATRGIFSEDTIDTSGYEA